MEELLNIKIKKSNGMTLIEVVIAVLMASIFMSIFAIVTEVIGKFLPTKSTLRNESKGLIIDHHKLQLTMDVYAEILSQPGISKSKIQTIMDFQSASLPKGCSLNPSVDWDIPVKAKPFLNQNWKPSSAEYALCLFKTQMTESTMEQLIESNIAKPGIYILLAIPNKISSNSLPTRRLFCRPRPFCSNSGL